MTVTAKPLNDQDQKLCSWLRVHSGHACSVTLRLADCASGSPVNWAGRRPRFRVYSQWVDNSIVVEVTDPERCRFEPEGIWKLQLTAEETAAMPRGGMYFTLEHAESDGSYEFGIRGGISCKDGRVEID